MRYYETLYIVNPNLENEALDKTMGEIRSELEKTSSKLINHRVWGKKRLAYPIQNQKYGSYILMHFEGGDQEKMVEFDTWMKLNNTVLRHMTVALSEQPEVYVEEVKEKPAEETTEDVTTEETVEAASADEAVAEDAPAEEVETETTEPDATEETVEEDAKESSEEVEEETEEKEAE